MNTQYYDMYRRPMCHRGSRPGRPPMGNQNSFLGPFILGGITGGLISPLFWGNTRPIYYPYYPYYPYYR